MVFLSVCRLFGVCLQFSFFFGGVCCFAVLSGRFCLGRMCSLCGSLLSLFLASLLGGSAGAGAPLLAPLPSVCAKVTKSSSLQAGAGVLCTPSLPPSSPSFRFSDPSPCRGRPPLFPAVSLSVCLSFSLFHLCMQEFHRACGKQNWP